MRIRVAVIGGGSWGTTVAHLAAHHTPTTLWARRPELAEEVNEHHTNERYLPGHRLHDDLRATADLADAVSHADVVVMGVPSQGFRSALEEVAQHVRAWVPILSLTKGLEQGTRLRMTQVVNEVLPGHPAAVLTGPNLAKEILAGDAAASVIATPDPVVAQHLQRIFHQRLFRVYVNPDVTGCEVAGALKNVIAIAAGMADGLGAGDNTKAAVITRGLAELSRLGEAMGGQFATFSGLAGMGDLMATCMSPQSRNRFVGEQLGAGLTIAEIIERMNMVAEGVKTSKVVMELADEYGVEMPISAEVYAVCHDGATAKDAYRGLIRGGGVEYAALSY
jgi:glycerol-3-phosphate dehydrogenase (NAD(P)+)